MGPLDGSLDFSNDVKLEGLFFGGSLGYTHGKVLGSDEGIKLGSIDGKVLGTILVNFYGTTLGIDVGTELGSLDRSFDVSNDGKLEELFLGDPPGSTDGKVNGYDKGIKMELFDGNVLGTILENVDRITWDLLMVTECRFRAAPVAARAGYHAIGARVIHRVAVTAVTDDY